MLELGKKSSYDSHYNPEKLFPISRTSQREALGITDKLPFYGIDIWNHYEVSWLNEKGKPMVALAEIIYGCDTPNIIESKSMKLYFNSFNNTPFKDLATVKATIKKDLEERLATSSVTVNISPIHTMQEAKLVPKLPGECIDALDISCSTYTTHPAFLVTENIIVEEILCSDLLKSNCLVTNQPDWCSVQIAYKGKKIQREGLLRYLVSFRNDNDFHEHCIEKIFMHVLEKCQPEKLTVYGRSTRRGGLDINSYRSTQKLEKSITNERLCRQ